MKIATTLFLLVVLVLGAFFFVGNLVEQNNNLRDQVSKLQQQIDQLNPKIADLTNQLNQANDQITALQKELDGNVTKMKDLETKLASTQKELGNTKARLADTLIQLQQVTANLDQIKADLALANGIQSQTQAALNQALAERDDLANQLKQSQKAASLAGLIPGGLGLPLVIGYGGLLAGVSLLGYKVYLTPRHAYLNQPAHPAVKLTMSERTYHEFQQYLKKGGK